MKIPKTYRLDKYHLALIEAIQAEGFKNNTHVIEVAIESMARQYLKEDVRERLFKEHFGTY